MEPLSENNGYNIHFFNTAPNANTNTNTNTNTNANTNTSATIYSKYRFG